MKNLFAILALLMPMNMLLGQDLIVTAEGDSLQCHIVSEEDNRMYFDFINTKGQKINTYVEKQEIVYFQHDYFSSKKETKTINSDRGRLGVDLGWGYKLGKVNKAGSSDLEKLIEQAKSGYTVGFEGAFFLSETFGLGLRYNYFQSSQKDGANSVKFQTSYFGPSLYARTPLRDHPNTFFICSIGFGYMGERQSCKYRKDNIDLKGHTIGSMAALGFDFKVSKQLGISVELAMLSGSLSKMEATVNGVSSTIKMNDDEREGLTRFELKVGLKLFP